MMKSAIADLIGDFEKQNGMAARFYNGKLKATVLTWTSAGVRAT